MSAFTCAHGETYALFGEGGGERLAAEIGAPLLGRVPLDMAVAAGGDAGEPVALAADGPVVAAFAELAGRIATDVAPVVEMSGCTVRMLDAVEQALGPKEPGAPKPG